MSPPDEPLQSLPSRVSEDEIQTAEQLGGGNRSRGVRRALQLAAKGAGARPSAKLSQLLEEALKQAHNLEAAAAADVSAGPSGAGWMPKPTPDLILQFHQLMPDALLAMPSGLMVWGQGPGGDECSLVIDSQNGQSGLADAGSLENVMVGIDGVGDLAAIADVLAQAHHRARLATAQGKPITSVVATCPALSLRVRPCDNGGLAVIELAGASIRLHPLAFMQLLAEMHALLAREIAKSVDQRQSLEQLLPVRPVVVGERSHGEG